MKQRVTLITLGADLPRRARGARGRPAPARRRGFSGGSARRWDRIRLPRPDDDVTLALNVGSPEEVDAVTEEARAAGATIGREPAETFWGGYSSVFVDPEGHPWEVAHNPRWTITADGGLRLG